jgi:hypothetical protein
MHGLSPAPDITRHGLTQYLQKQVPAGSPVLASAPAWSDAKVALGSTASSEGDCGCEHLCYLAGCPADHWLLGYASGTCQTGLGLAVREMISGLWA